MKNPDAKRIASRFAAKNNMPQRRSWAKSGIKHGSKSLLAITEERPERSTGMALLAAADFLDMSHVGGEKIGQDIVGKLRRRGREMVKDSKE